MRTPTRLGRLSPEERYGPPREQVQELLDMLERAYLAINRHEWEEGETLNEVGDAMLATLNNFGRHPEREW